MHVRLAPLVVVLLAAALARAEGSRLAPVPKADAVSTHGPYEMGACETCHQRSDPANPGPALEVTNALCFECHEEFKGTTPVRMEHALHPSTPAACTTCHNPHNSRKKKLRL